jgi:hypothetical protein
MPSSGSIAGCIQGAEPAASAHALLLVPSGVFQVAATSVVLPLTSVTLPWSPAP